MINIKIENSSCTIDVSKLQLGKEIWKNVCNNLETVLINEINKEEDKWHEKAMSEIYDNIKNFHNGRNKSFYEFGFNEYTSTFQYNPRGGYDPISQMMDIKKRHQKIIDQLKEDGHYACICFRCPAVPTRYTALGNFMQPEKFVTTSGALLVYSKDSKKSKAMLEKQKLNI